MAPRCEREREMRKAKEKQQKNVNGFRLMLILYESHFRDNWRRNYFQRGKQKKKQ
jgi:hypothetical protein